MTREIILPGNDNATSDLAPETALYLPGASGNYVSTPDHADLDPADDLEIVFRILRSDYTPSTGQTVAAKRSLADGLAWQLNFSPTTGNLAFSFRSGSTDYFTDSELANPGWVDGTPYWFRFRRVSSTGAVSGDYAADQRDEPSSWTSLTVSGTETSGAIDGNAAPVEVGSNRDGGSNMFAGQVRRLLVRTTIGGSAVADLRTDAPMGDRYRDTTGKVWTISGSAWTWMVA